MVKAICGKPSSDGQTSKNECLGVYRREFHALSLAWPTPVNRDHCTPSVLGVVEQTRTASTPSVCGGVG